MRRIVLPGGTGHLGRLLASHFHALGDDVTVLTRSRRASSGEAWKTLTWDGATLGEWASAIDGADVVINLAGRGVNCRYNEARRQEILESRVRSTRVVGEAIARAKVPPKLWMNMSTATIYRHTFGAPNDEVSGVVGIGDGTPPEWGFSIDVAQAWERAFSEARVDGTRKIALRSAVVMLRTTENDSAFDIMLSLVRQGLGGAVGSGKQFISWIHHTDFVRAIEFLINHEALSGVVNVAAPNPLPNRDFMRELRKAAGVRFGPRLPEWAVRLGAIFKGTEPELVLKSRRVVSKRLADAGLTFTFPEWPGAAQDLVARSC